MANSLPVSIRMSTASPQSPVPEYAGASDWQPQCFEMKRRGLRVLQSGQWADCTFAVGVERRTFSAHRLLLAMASPVFEAMLYGNFPEGNRPILVEDLQPEAFRILLEYIYTDDIDIPSCNIAYGLYLCAEKYLLPHVSSVCLSFLMSNLTPKNACLTFEFAELIDKAELRDECVKIIKSKTLECLKHNSFEILQIDTVVKIFSLDTLNIDSELDLCDAAIRYSESNYISYNKPKGTNRIDSNAKPLHLEEDGNISPRGSNKTSNGITASDDESPKKKRKMPEEDALDLNAIGDPSSLPIRRAVKQIRFLNIDPQNFAEYDMSPLLTDREIYAVAMNLMSTNTHLEMPRYFSNSRTPRNESYTTTTIDKGRATATIRVVVNDFANFRSIRSPTFHVRYLPWKLTARTSYSADGSRTFLGVYLHCNWKDHVAWSCKTWAEFRLLSHRVDTKPHCLQMEHQLQNDDAHRGYERFLPWSEVLNPSKGYIKHGAITLEVQIKADVALRCNSQQKITH